MLRHPPSWSRALVVFASLLAAMGTLPGCGGSSRGSDAGSDAGGGDQGVDDQGVDDQGVDDQGVDACEVDEHVVSHACVACGAGSTNAAGDDPSGADTTCDPDPCFGALGLDCSDFDEAYIKASNTATNDQFGLAVALSGDTLVVGAWHENSDSRGVDQDQTNEGGDNSGAVYVFVRDGDGVWSQQAYLKASNADAGDEFGAAVAVSGDLIAVGAALESSNATDVDGDEDDNTSQFSGAVYVFHRDGQGDWAQEAYLKASNAGAGDFFGYSVSLSEDTLAVGAIGEDSAATGVDGMEADNSASRAGAVYVFERSSAGAWTQEAYIKASNTSADDEFCRSLALHGDLLAVGAMREDSDGSGVDGDQNDDGDNTGAVYVFHRDGSGTWSEEAYLKAQTPGNADFFGRSAALSDDTLVVGAMGEGSDATGVDGDQGDNDAPASGAAYVFRRDGAGVWTQEAYLKASNTQMDDYFGASVAVSGDFIAVGTSEEASNATGVDGDGTNNDAGSSGAVYLFRRDVDDDWSQVAYLKASNTGEGDRFGLAMVLSGDRLVVSAPYEDSDATGIGGDQTNNDAPSAGAVYVRRLAP